MSRYLRSFPTRRSSDLFLELLDGGLLDDALPGGHDQVVALLEVRDRDHRQDRLSGVDLDALEIDDRDALGGARRVGRLVEIGRASCRERVWGRVVGAAG